MNGKTKTATLLSVPLVLATALLFSGCSTSPLSAQYEEGSNKGYISADGTVAEWPQAERGDPVDFTGATETGETLTVSDYRGSVVVLNFWYAGCPPCRAEAPDLQELHETYADQNVAFVGVNVRDQASTALSFSEEFGTTYPSILDAEDKSASLALSGQAAPNAVPTTIVLDAEGRPASRILGQIPSKSVLNALIKDTLAEASR